MSNIPYREHLKDCRNLFHYRMIMVNYALQHGIKPAAVEFMCSKNTIRKWLRRYAEQGLKGLNNMSNRPKHSPNQIPYEEEKEIAELRNLLKKISPERMRYEFGIKRSVSAIYRVIKQNCISRPKWKKQIKKNDLRAEKAKLRVFEKIQIDIKELKDIPNYWPYMRRHKLPKYQFTARDVRSGALFFAYGHTKDSVNASTFCSYLLAHLKRFGVDIKKVNVQTDNDGAFVGNWRVNSSAPFKYIIEQIYKAAHLRIPPSAPTHNSDVETSHARIEEEFYDVDEFNSTGELINKGLTYQAYFNIVRPNRYRQMKSPLKIIEELMGPTDPYLLVLPPIVLDEHFELYESTVKSRSGGHHLPESLSFADRTGAWFPGRAGTDPRIG